MHFNAYQTHWKKLSITCPLELWELGCQQLRAFTALPQDASSFPSPPRRSTHNNLPLKLWEIQCRLLPTMATMLICTPCSCAHTSTGTHVYIYIHINKNKWWGFWICHWTLASVEDSGGIVVKNVFWTIWSSWDMAQASSFVFLMSRRGI